MDDARADSRRRSTLRTRWVLAPAALGGLVLGGSWYATEPLESPPGTPPAASGAASPRSPARSGLHAESTAAVADIAEAAEPAVAGPLTWPDEPLDGPPAKELLLNVLLVAQERLHEADGYLATFHKQERIGGTLKPRQTMQMKVRHEPFSVYLKFLHPKAGKEAVYCEGRYDNHVIAHNGDWSRMLVPRLKVAPTDSLALADNRHPITDAGLKNLVDRLVDYRRLDLDDSHAATLLDRTTDERGRTRYRSIHTHPHRKADRPFARVEVLYDPDTLIPHRISSYDWPAPGHQGDLDLAECYTYEDIDLEARFEDADFDPSNPQYAFTRF